MTKYLQAEQLARSIQDPKVRAAFSSVDRSRFVPADLRLSAWSDRPLPIADNATISQPSLVAEMTEWLNVQPGHKVLEIGTGSGYQTAILARLAHSVSTIEISEALSQSAQQLLEELGYTNIRFHIGDGATGWPEPAAFDRIISTVAFPSHPERLLAQLNSHGRCLAPVGPPGTTQWLMLYDKQDGKITKSALIPVRFLGLR